MADPYKEAFERALQAAKNEQAAKDRERQSVDARLREIGRQIQRQVADALTGPGMSFWLGRQPENEQVTDEGGVAVYSAIVRYDTSQGVVLTVPFKIERRLEGDKIVFHNQTSPLLEFSGAKIPLSLRADLNSDSGPVVDVEKFKKDVIQALGRIPSTPPSGDGENDGEDSVQGFF